MPSRRQFLRGSFSANRTKVALTPPWATDDFINRCTRCSDCASACPTGIIVKGDGAYPQLDFSRGECTFCTACTDACATGAIKHSDVAPPWFRSIAINTSCLAQNKVVCRSCAEVCEASAIAFPARLGGVAAPLIDDAACTGCGACVAICPSQSIQVQARAPRSEPIESQRRVA